MTEQDTKRASAFVATTDGPSRRTIWLLLTFVVASAALPRCWTIASQGVEDHDGANLTLESQLVVTVGDAVSHKLLRREYALPELEQVRGRPMTYAKPLYTLSLVPGWLVRIPRVYIAPLFSAVWSLLTVFVIFFVARALWDDLVGLLAAAFLGSSGFAAYYARSGSAESFGFFCFALALLAYVHLWNRQQMPRSNRMTLLVGVAWGAAILANYKLLVVAAIVLSTGELTALVTQGRHSITRSVLIAAGLFGTLIATELIFQLAVFAWRRVGGEFHAITYWEQLRFLVFEKRTIDDRFDVRLSDNLYNFAHYWWRAEGPVLPLFGGVGILLSILQRPRFSNAAAPLALATVFMACVWPLQSFIVPRAMAGMIVLLAPFAGLTAARMARRWCLERSATGAAIFIVGYLLLVSTMVNRIGLEWFNMSSAFRNLAHDLADHQDEPLFAHWRVKPQVSLYVTDRPVRQVNDGEDVGEWNQSNFPTQGLLVASSEFVDQHIPDAEVLQRWPLRQEHNELALAEDLFSWDESVARRGRELELQLVRLREVTR